MPRIAERNRHSRAATERWRERLREQREPESCHADVAVATAVAVILDRLRETGRRSADIEEVLSVSKQLMKSRGYGGRSSARRLMTRLLFRKDLPGLRNGPSQPRLKTAPEPSEPRPKSEPSASELEALAYKGLPLTDVNLRNRQAALSVVSKAR
ncbi:hypothetical protein ASG25_21155 [Rhizobium sp. Leaf384]|nr:hypothetical protein ASG25_21155 [Rhizobium sp. Leaf384]KQS83950.1 hypothetical protein ASG58_21535 [Rhizobium sp. Leaf383]